MDRIDLSGVWRFVPDPGASSAEYARPGYDRSGRESAPVPGCWNLDREHYALYEGVAWHARTFRSPGGGPAQVRFDGVNYEAAVVLNGAPLGTHRGGSAGFRVSTGDALRAGENKIVVHVDNRRHRMHSPAVSGWMNYGGIHGRVWLELEPRPVQPAPEPRARLAGGRLEVDGRPAPSPSFSTTTPTRASP